MERGLARTKRAQEVCVYRQNRSSTLDKNSRGPVISEFLFLWLLLQRKMRIEFIILEFFH